MQASVDPRVTVCLPLSGGPFCVFDCDAMRPNAVSTQACLFKEPIDMRCGIARFRGGYGANAV